MLKLCSADIVKNTMILSLCCVCVVLGCFRDVLRLFGGCFRDVLGMFW